MKTSLLSIAALSVLSLAACTPADNGNQTSSSAATVSSSSATAASENIQVTAPHAGTLVSSPLTVTGQAKGTWYFEASFPVRLLDGNGNEIAITPAQAQGDWMTTDFVPFVATLSFTKPATPTGTLILENDNPSGDPSRAMQIAIPVRF